MKIGNHLSLYIILSLGCLTNANSASAAVSVSYRCVDSETVIFDRKFFDKDTEYVTKVCTPGKHWVIKGKPGEALQAASYGVQRTLGRNTYIEAAFIEPDTSGGFEQAPFEDALLALGGTYLFPSLESSSTDLFVGVDLTDWMPNEFAFSDGDIFEFVAGYSSSLPGFVVGTSEVTFSDTVGWTTATPFTGPATAAGGADGVPEPSTIALLLLGLGVPVFWRTARLNGNSGPSQKGRIGARPRFFSLNQ
jgi:hypothetical protein